MDPVIIVIICAVSFGALVAIGAFIRMLILSRDKRLNDEAQKNALTQETLELEKIRIQMQSSKRFDNHYKILGTNKDAILYLDNKIEEIIRKKTELMNRYTTMSTKESGSMVSGECFEEQKDAFDQLRYQMDDELKYYEDELKRLQQRKTNLWDAHSGLQEHLVQQEKARNEHLDDVYKQHSLLLEKVYLGHIKNSERFAKKSIGAGTSTFKAMVVAPFQFILQYFNLTTRPSQPKAQIIINPPNQHHSAKEVVKRPEARRKQEAVKPNLEKKNAPVEEEVKQQKIPDAVIPEESDDDLEREHTIRFTTG